MTEGSTSDLQATSTSSDTASNPPFEKKSRSHVWKYFRRHQDKADCLLCDKTFSYNGGTKSNLISHLERKHPSIIKSKEEEGCQANTTRQLSIGDFAKLNFLEASQREIIRILSRWPLLLSMMRLPMSCLQVSFSSL